MKIAIAGTGYVGLVTAVCLAHHKHDVTCVDVDEHKIQMMREGKSPIYEEGLEELMNLNASRLTYTSDYSKAYADKDVIFIGVGTPEKKDGSANLDYVYTVCAQIAESVTRDTLVVVKSTVPIGTNDDIEAYFKEHCKYHIDVASNPEFLAQGTAVHDTLHAERIVVGTENLHSEEIMSEVYKDFGIPILKMNRRSAEMVKYASNDFLALKISYVNEIANLCETLGANIEDVTKGMGMDSRIGNKFLKAGIGYGGSCFPKDTKALHWLSVINDVELKTVKAAIEVNARQKIRLYEKAKKNGVEFKGKKVAVLGLTFKPNTDDLRDAPSLDNIPLLLECGANVYAYDPVGVENFKKRIPEGITYASIEECLTNADICFIFTEWKEVREIQPETFNKLMKQALVYDGRNCYDVAAMEAAGVKYYSIGR